MWQKFTYLFEKKHIPYDYCTFRIFTTVVTVATVATVNFPLSYCRDSNFEDSSTKSSSGLLLLTEFCLFCPRVNTTEKIYARQNEDKPICLTSQKCFLMSSQILPRILQITRHESFPWKKHNQFLVFTTSNYTLWYPSHLLIIMLSGIIFQLNMIMYIIKIIFFFVL